MGVSFCNSSVTFVMAAISEDFRASEEPVRIHSNLWNTHSSSKGRFVKNIRRNA